MRFVWRVVGTVLAVVPRSLARGCIIESRVPTHKHKGDGARLGRLRVQVLVRKLADLSLSVEVVSHILLLPQVALSLSLSLYHEIKKSSSAGSDGAEAEVNARAAVGVRR